MPLVEVIPTSRTSAATPGWSYVVDTGYDPSKAAIVPSGARDRARNSILTGAGTRESYSARQQAIVAKHIIDLDRENPRDIQINVPNKSSNVAHRSISGNMTQAVRKILQSNKTWANYLADEEAAAASQPLQQQQSRMTSAQHPESKQSAPKKRKSLVPPPKATPAKRGRPPKYPKKEPEAMDIDAEPTVQETTTVQKGITEADTATPISTVPDEDPFLKPRVPTLPTGAEIEALLSTPPLAYAAARAAPTASTAPPRQFCEMCGYWGRARCMKCGAKVCGLDCKTQHDETRCQKLYA